MVTGNRQRVRGRVGRALLLALSVLVGGLPGMGLAQAPPGVTVRVVLVQQTYVLGVDPLKLAIIVENVSGDTVLVSQRVFEEIPLALTLTFVRPDGVAIIADLETLPSPEPPPPLTLPIEAVGGGTTAYVPVDRLVVMEPGFVESVTVADARALYSKLDPGAGPVASGFYQVWATVPFRTYPAVYRVVAGESYAALDPALFEGVLQSVPLRFAVVADADGDGYTTPVADPASPPPGGVDCDDSNAAINPGATEVVGDGVDNDCNPATLDMTPVPPATVAVTALRQVTGKGGGKFPLGGLTVNAYDISLGSCPSTTGLVASQFATIFLNCAADVVATGTTDGAGQVSLAVPPGDYLLLTRVPPAPPVSPEETYLGTQVNTLDPGTTRKIKLRQLVKKKK